jgi:adenylate cyclase
MGVLQSAAGSSDFFPRAAQAIVDIVGLDSGHVLVWERGLWTTQAQATAPTVAAEADWKPSSQVLHRVRQEKRTFWEAGGHAALDAPSLVGIKVVVAAPILNPQGEVIGALYGDRRQGSLIAGPPQISKLEAMLVELLASGVAAGLARLEQERAVLAARLQFEQFFTPELASQLAAEPDLLQGRDAEVTLLFCDIRSFSRHSAKLGPSGTVDLISDVMSTLSECVLEHRGVLVDYIGDELMAMWGAPKPQPDHAQLACRSALDMLNRLPELNGRWQEVLKEPMDVGVGINTGVARVGNTGSRHKFKYGPLGNTVNLASRLQGATKYLRARLLVSGATHAQLDASFSARRLGKVRVINIAEPVDLYELAAPGQPDWPALQEGHEQALDAFETAEFHQVAKIIGKLLLDHPGDGPSLVLLSRALAAIIEPPDSFDPVWELPGK